MQLLVTTILLSLNELALFLIALSQGLFKGIFIKVLA
jgi:hypothetical protein